MIDGRGASLISTCDQWSRSWHDGTAVEGGDGALTLQWVDQLAQLEPGQPLEPARGIVQDRLCRVYRLGATSVGRTAIASTVDGLDYAHLPDEVAVIDAGTAATAGEAGTGIIDGAGLAVDRDDRLFISDRGSRAIHVIDIWSGRLLRTVRLNDSVHPDRHAVGLTTDGSNVWAAMQEPRGLVRLSSRSDTAEVTPPTAVGQLPSTAQPARLAVLSDGTLASLWVDTTSSDAWLLAGDRIPYRLENVADIVADADGIIVAPAEGAATPQLQRLTPTATSWLRRKPLDAAGYLGGGIVPTDGGRIGFFTRAGFRLATEGVVRYVPKGTCVTYRLDSGQPLNRWGRVSLEACIPRGTKVQFGAVTTDDETGSSIPQPPHILTACPPDDRIDAPPLPSQRQVDALLDQRDTLHRRTIPPTPWWRHQIDEPYDTYEAPIAAPPGRYLWLTVELSGGAHATPRVREVRVERHAHKLMRRLPEVFSREPAAEAFLHRYLSMVDSVARDLDLRAVHRDLLVDPRSTPIEMLDWLASFVGLVLDERWVDAARRRLVQEAVQLYRLRGTPWALSRYIEIYLAGDDALGDDRRWQRPVIVEHYRLRGLGGAQLSEQQPIGDDGSVVGVGFRVGGEPATDDNPPLDSKVLSNGSFGTTAHRFSILIPRTLSPEDESIIRHALDLERPAHTDYELCTIDAGMRAGHRLHLGISTLVGPTGAFAPSIVGSFALGTDTILGRPTGEMQAGTMTVGTERVR